MNQFGGSNDPYQALAILQQVYILLRDGLNDPNRQIAAYNQYGPMLNAQQVRTYHYNSTDKPASEVVKPVIDLLEQYLGISQPTSVPEYEEPLRLWIVVDGGDTFEGNEEQWADCYFSNVTIEGIEEFCKENDWQVEITRRE